MLFRVLCMIGLFFAARMLFFPEHHKRDPKVSFEICLSFGILQIRDCPPDVFGSAAKQAASRLISAARQTASRSYLRSAAKQA